MAVTCIHQDAKQWRREQSKKYRDRLAVFCDLCGKWIGYEIQNGEKPKTNDSSRTDSK